MSVCTMLHLRLSHVTVTEHHRLGEIQTRDLFLTVLKARRAKITGLASSKELLTASFQG